ncbi:uncharacterized protein MONBRDRAFT_31889 [Monosiga brevicollis MX1]|uniref:Protein regulator of cytokinesis 1 n=1 Tax=Monosiga brevicollis TaxID=81824 RepID=A9UW21_MONBE|nr:uncharacterized protein MONBRDRAFT_31889 [Monosiga brevicollis MX1]EDQ90692.1 predicted protein [Monosiga brevicollis MX1]|eukprot:XP_001744743.1 hypothetical protein [Monosiga brevicollis MX1]
MAEALMTRAQDALLPTWQRLAKLWTRLGLEEDEQLARQNEVVGHIQQLVDELAAEEQKQCDAIVQLVAENRMKLQGLRAELQLEDAEPLLTVDTEYSLLRLDADLESRVQELEEIKFQRLEERSFLETRMGGLARTLDLSPEEAPLCADNDISQACIERLKSRLHEIERELEERQSAVAPTVGSIQALWHELAYEPEDDFERGVIENVAALPLSVENIGRLRHLQDKLQRIKDQLDEMVNLAWVNLHRRWAELEVDMSARRVVCKQLGLPSAAAREAKAHTPPPHGDSLRIIREANLGLDEIQRAKLPVVLAKRYQALCKWWRKCFVGEIERQEFLEDELQIDAANEDDDAWHHVPEERREEVLRAMEAAIANLQEQYQSQKDLFAAADVIESYRTKLAATTDEDRLRNRGGLLARLDRMAKSAKLAERRIQDWEDEHGEVFLVNGNPYLETLEDERRRQQEKQHLEAEQRRQRAKNQTEHEMLYGSTPLTPRRVTKAVARTPTSAKRRNTALTAAGKTPKRVPLSLRNESTVSSPMKAQPMTSSKLQAKAARAKQASPVKKLYSRQSLARGLGSICGDSSTAPWLEPSLSVLSPTSFERELRGNLMSTRLGDLDDEE